MAEWKVQSEWEWERKWRGKLGNEEFERRLAIADAKADELLGEAKSGDPATEKKGRISDAAWAEATLMRGQFRGMAMQMSAGALVKAERLSGRKWASIIYKLAGV